MTEFNLDEADQEAPEQIHQSVEMAESPPDLEQAPGFNKQ